MILGALGRGETADACRFEIEMLYPLTRVSQCGTEGWGLLFVDVRQEFQCQVQLLRSCPPCAFPNTLTCFRLKVCETLPHLVRQIDRDKEAEPPRFVVGWSRIGHKTAACAYPDGFLLGDTMKGAEPPDEFSGIDPNHFVLRHLALQNFDGAIIVWLTIGRHQDNPVRDVKIRVARRQALAFVFDEARHREFNDSKWLTRFVTERLEPSKVVLEDSVVFIRRVLFNRCHDGSLIDEAANVVNMPIRIVAYNSFTEPQHVGDAKVIDK